MAGAEVWGTTAPYPFRRFNILHLEIRSASANQHARSASAQHLCLSIARNPSPHRFTQSHGWLTGPVSAYGGSAPITTIRTGRAIGEPQALIAILTGKWLAPSSATSLASRGATCKGRRSPNVNTRKRQPCIRSRTPLHLAHHSTPPCPP